MFDAEKKKQPDKPDYFNSDRVERICPRLLAHEPKGIDPINVADAIGCRGPECAIFDDERRQCGDFSQIQYLKGIEESLAAMNHYPKY